MLNFNILLEKEPFGGIKLNIFLKIIEKQKIRKLLGADFEQFGKEPDLGPF